MNIFLPQSNQAKIELEEIADSQRQVITPALSLPIIGIVQDGLLGAYNLSQPTMKIDWKSAMNIMSYTTLDDFSAFKKKQEHVGTDLFSLIIPPEINTSRGIDITNGHINKGILNKGVLGSKKPQSLIHLIWEQYGHEETRKFIDNTQRLVNNFNMWNGFSVGVGDINIPKSVDDQLHVLFETKKLEVDHLITEMENNPDLVDAEVFEQTIRAELGSIRDNASKLIMSNLQADNKLNIMIKSGSKGDDSNMGQMGACIGQQQVESKRIRNRYNGRSLQYFFQGNDSALGRGFVERPFIKGADPIGFMFHNMGAREGLIDTAIKTAESGYIQRKLIKSLEDLSIKYDGTVRSSNNHIIQFVYGDNGVDTTKQSEHNLYLLEKGNDEISKLVKFSAEELKNFKGFTAKDNEDYYQQILTARNELRQCRIKAAVDNITFDSAFMLPVNISNTINIIKNSGMKGEKLEPAYIVKRLEEIITYDNTRVLAMSPDEVSNTKSLKFKDEVLSKIIFKFSLYEYLSPKMVLAHGLNKAQFDMVCEQVIDKFNRSIVDPGEMVGIVSAQSIGEPVTQMSNHRLTQIIIVANPGNKVMEKLSGSNIYYGPVGKFIDTVMKEKKDKLVTIHKDSVVLDLPKDEFSIVGVSNSEKTSWNNILQLSRHLANGKLVKVTTRTGRTTTATLTHSFLKRTKNGIEAIKGSDLKVGTRIPISKSIPTIKDSTTKVMIGDKQVDLDISFGWFCGAYLAEGSISGSTISISNISDEFINRVKKTAKFFDREANVRKFQGEYGPSTTTSFCKVELATWLTDNFGNGSFNKVISGFVFGSSLPFIKGLLRGYFDGDGNVNAQVGKQMIRCGSRSDELIKGVSLLLNYCGIFATIAEDRRTTDDSVLHTLQISRKYAKKFRDEIGTNMDYKLADLNKIIEYTKREEKKTDLERIDRIPELGDVIAETGKLLELPGQSRNYGRWAKKEAIGRKTLKKYIKIFKETLDDFTNTNVFSTIETNIKILEQAANSDIIWDEIIKLEILDDPKEYVYDFTVPGNDSFMVDSGVFVHNTLNTFHAAGIKSSVSLGVPRMKELLSLSKNIKTPTMTLNLDKKYRTSDDIANKIASYLKHTKFSDIRKKIDILYDPNPLKKGGFMDQDNVYNTFYSYSPSKNACQNEITGLPWLLRIELDREKIMEKDITLLDIKSKFCNHWEKRYGDIKGLGKEERELLERITQTSILSNSDNDKSPVIHIRFDMTEFNFAILISFIDTFVDNFQLKGVPHITKINGVNEEPVVSFDNENEEMKKEKQYVIYTDGVNLADLRYINGIDLNTSVCNDVITIYEMYGIDAARAALIKEYKTVFIGAGNRVNYAHLELLADLMTSSGQPISIDRHGLSKLDVDPLARASFEKTVEQLINASVFGEVDHMNNVSSRIMAGLVIKGGTGLCEVVLDSELLEKSEYTEDIEQQYVKTYNEVSENSVVIDMIKKEVSGIFIPE